MMDQALAPSRWRRLRQWFSPPVGSALEPIFRRLRARLWLVCCVLLACGIYLYYVSAGGLKHWPIYGTYLDLQADAFRAGHSYLALEPDPRLVKAADPYDKVNIRYWALD